MDDLTRLAVGWLRGEIGSCAPERLQEAADRIEADAATIATLRAALEKAPIIGALESRDHFRKRQDEWLNGAYRAALANTAIDLRDRG